MSDLPEGTLTFVFTDIVGSTRLWEQDPAAMSRALPRHGEIIAEVVARHRGTLVRPRGEGDSTFSVFPHAPDATAAAYEIQRLLGAEPWPKTAAIQARIALHTGVGESDGFDYNSSDVNRCARLRAIAHGGQVLLSRATAELVGDSLPHAVILRDLGLHRLKDLNRPERVYQLVHSDLPDDFPPPVSLSTLPNNLPQQLTTFVGREAEMAEVRRLLELTRCLTIAGAGGLGKTRLALQTAAIILEDYPDGVWQLELAPLRDGALVARELARVLGVPDEPGKAVDISLVERLLEQRALIVLDNCEHLIDATAQLAESLLLACPFIRILATSREPLRIHGETVWRLSPLQLPEAPNPQRPGDVSILAACDLIRLFVERARSAQPAFRLTERTAPIVADICRRLDGIPLAIELASARVRAMGVERIADRLDDRFRLLTGGIRTALPRQQTLEALIAWSYDLLDESECGFFLRVSVFSGGWDLDAAESIAEGQRPDDPTTQRPGREGIVNCKLQTENRKSPNPDTLDLLTQLVDKSLVILDERPDGRERYRMLETIRQYARERLDESGRRAAVRERHLRYYAALVEEAEPHLTGPEQAGWLERLEAEHDNLRAALWFGRALGIRGRADGQSADARNPDNTMALRLASAVWRFWLVRGYLEEGYGWLTSLIAQARDGEEDAVLARALHAAGRLAGCLGDYGEAACLLQEALALQKRLGDHCGAAASLLSLGVVSGERGDMEMARSYFEHSLDLQRAIGDTRGSAMSLQNLGNVAVYQQDWSRARALLEESLALCRELGDAQGTAIALNNLGHICARLDEFDTAHGHFAESLAIFNRVGYKSAIASCTDELAKLAIALHDPERASRLFAVSESLREAIGSLVPPTDQAEYDGMLADLRSDLGEARFATAWSDGRALTLDQAVVYALEDCRPSAERLPVRSASGRG